MPIMKGEDKWEECSICMEPTNFDAIIAQYWLCCGQRMCSKCNDSHDLMKKGKISICPFCRSTQIYADDPNAQSQLLMFADKGKAWAQCCLGYRFSVEKNMEKAIYYYTLAADQGSTNAQYNLGFIYKDGKGVPVDYEKALHYYKLAAEGGALSAYNNIGVMYKEGLGVPQSYEKAFEYYKVGADKGNRVAQYNLGNLYYLGEGVKEDISLAIKHLSLSADQHDEDAVTLLAGILIDLVKDDKETKYLFQAMCRTKCALKIITETHEDYNEFKDFLEWTKTFCGGCGGENKSDLLACARCKVIMYCNVNCQKKHWKQGGHKQECIIKK